MALTYDWTRCSITAEEVAENNKAVEAAIFVTMAIDIGDWTPQRIEEIEARIRFYERLSGNDYTDVINLLPKLIGLRTNVAYIPEKKWLKRITENIMMTCHYDVKTAAKFRELQKEKENNGKSDDSK